jgi:hypothetical protein
MIGVLKMKPSELEEENQKLREQIASLQHRITELELAKSKGKGRSLAEAGLVILEAEGAVPLSRFAALTKNPSDVVYNIRHILKVEVASIRSTTGTVYLLEERLKAKETQTK